jgi:hypothetical protein
MIPWHHDGVCQISQLSKSIAFGMVKNFTNEEKS